MAKQKSGISLFLLAFSLPAALHGQTSSKSVVSVLNAQQTEYRKDPVTGGNAIMLLGGVEVSVEKDGTTTAISADRVNYNREKDLLYAEGNITLHRTEKGGNEETLTANTLLFDVGTYAGIFDGARIVSLEALSGGASNSALPNSSASSSDATGGKSTMIVSSELFGRDSESTIAFKNGTLTFCDDENPHWRINASRIWLLPGAEFAFFNAVLFVGHIPVLYLPFFYYPKDELIFNPAFGYDSGKGYFVQTTTYFVGRKKLPEDSESDALFSFMQNTKLKEQRREGLMLHNLDTDLAETPKHTLKFMGDYYSNLGWMAGAAGEFTPPKIVSKVDFSLYAGFSRTLFPTIDRDNVLRGDMKTIYAPLTGEIYKDTSNLFDIEIPFRYKGNFNLSLTQPFSLDIKMPVYSDIYFDRDFTTDRKESMDWLSYITENVSSSEDEETTTATTGTTSFIWSLSAPSISVPTGKVSPYISALSFLFDASLTFTESKIRTDLPKYTEDYDYPYTKGKEILPVDSPQQTFFYPSQAVPVHAGMTMSGTLLSYPAAITSRTYRTPPAGIAVPADFAAGASKDAQKDADAAEKKSVAETSGGAAVPPDTEIAPKAEEQTKHELKPLLPAKSLPEMTASVSQTAARATPFSYSFGYSVKPDYKNDISYDNSLKTPSDFSWDGVRLSQIRFSSPIKLDEKASFYGDFLGVTNTLAFLPVYQHHPILPAKDETNEAASRRTIMQNDYGARKLDTELANNVSLKPLLSHPVFANSSLSWNGTVKLLRTEFTGTPPKNSTEEPKAEWKYHAPEWNAESVTAHTMSAAFSAQEQVFLAAKSDFSQTLTLSSNLPPQPDRYSAELAFAFPYVTALSGKAAIKHKSKDDAAWVWEPFDQSLSVKFLSDKLSFAQSYSYSLQDKHPALFSAKMSGYGFDLLYDMSYAYRYNFVEKESSGTWERADSEKFIPKSLSLKYVRTASKFYFWKNRVNFAPGGTTELRYDLIQSTNSYFSFAPSLTFYLHQGLELTFSSESRNNTVARYLDASLPERFHKSPSDLFDDLWHSFAFWDTSLRKQSAFKLQNLKLEVTHSLHDWDLSSSLTIAPRQLKDPNTNKPYTDINPLFTVAVLWKPLKSMRTKIEDQYGTWTLNS